MSGDAIPERRIALTIATNWVLQNSKKTPTQASLLFRTEIFALAWLSRRNVCHGGLCHDSSGRTISHVKLEKCAESESTFDGTRSISGRVLRALARTPGSLNPAVTVAARTGRPTEDALYSTY